MKKVGLSILCLAMSGYLFGSCYSTWSTAFDKATYEYQLNVNSCKSALSVERCLREANLAYNHAVNTAGDAFYNCGIQ